MNNGQPVATVIGAGRGIGAAIALALADNGFHIMINDILDEEHVKPRLEKIQALGRIGVYCKANISKSSDRIKISRHLSKDSQ